MSDKIMDKIMSSENLDDLIKSINEFINYKENNKQFISLGEFERIYMLIKNHNDSIREHNENNEKNKIKGQDWYIDLNTLARINDLLNCSPQEIINSKTFYSGNISNELSFNMVQKKRVDNEFESYSVSEEEDFIKDQFAKDLKSAVRFVSLLTKNFEDCPLKLGDIINLIDLNKENDWAKYLILFDHKNQIDNLDGKIISDIFKNYSGQMSKSIFEWLIKLAKPGAINKSVIDKFFSNGVNFDIELISCYGDFNLDKICSKCEKGSISSKIAESIFMNLDFNGMRLTQGQYDLILSAFDDEAKKLVENKLKSLLIKFEDRVNLNGKTKCDSYEEFWSLATQFSHDLVFDHENLMKLCDLAPIPGTEINTGITNDLMSCWVVESFPLLKAFANLDGFHTLKRISSARKCISKFVKDAIAQNKKLSLNELKATVLFGVADNFFNFETCGISDKNQLKDLIPDEFDGDYLYWLSQFFEDAYESDKNALYTIDKEYISFLADRFKGNLNQFTLSNILAAVEYGVIDPEVAKKLLNGFKFVDGKQIEIDDDEYKKIEARFMPGEAREILKNAFVEAKELAKQNGVKDHVEINNNQNQITVGPFGYIKNNEDLKKFVDDRLEQNKIFSVYEYNDLVYTIGTNGGLEPDLETVFKICKLMPEELIKENTNIYHKTTIGINGSKSDEVRNKAISDFTKEKLKEDPVNALRFASTMYYYHPDGIKFADFNNLLDFSKSNRYADYIFNILGYRAEEQLVNKENLKKVFSNYESAGIMSSQAFYNLIECIEDKSISEDIAKKLFSKGFNFKLNVVPLNKYDKRNLFSLCKKIESDEIGLELAKKIMANVIASETELSNVEYTKILSVFKEQDGARKYVKNELENLGNKAKANILEENDQVLEKVIDVIKTGEQQKVDKETIDFVNDHMIVNKPSCDKFISDIKNILSDASKTLEKDTSEIKSSDLTKVITQIGQILEACQNILCLSDKEKEDCAEKLKLIKSLKPSAKAIIKRFLAGLLLFITFRFKEGAKIMANSKEQVKVEQQSSSLNNNLSKIKQRIANTEIKKNTYWSI